MKESITCLALFLSGITLGITLDDIAHRPAPAPPPATNAPAETIWLPTHQEAAKFFVPVTQEKTLHFTEPEVCEALREFYAQRWLQAVPMNNSVLRWEHNCWDSRWEGGRLGSGLSLELKP